MTNYITYGNICNRYCLKYFNRKTISFSKPCRLTSEKHKELKARNERKLDPYNEDGDFKFDEPFPSTPQKMEFEFIECQNSGGELQTYSDFVQAEANFARKKEKG